MSPLRCIHVKKTYQFKNQYMDDVIISDKLSKTATMFKVTIDGALRAVLGKLTNKTS